MSNTKQIEYKPKPTTIKDAHLITLDQCEQEHRYGRLIFFWGAVKKEPLQAIGSLLQYFFPIDIHLLGDDGYVYIGMSPLFEKVDGCAEKMKLSHVPFYNMAQDDSGCITVVKMNIDVNRIKKPTMQQIKELS